MKIKKAKAKKGKSAPEVIGKGGIGKYLGHLEQEGAHVKGFTPGQKVKMMVHGKVSSIHQHEASPPRASIDVKSIKHMNETPKGAKK